MKNFGIVAGVLGFVGVALGALGAHALRDRLQLADMLEAWQTAVLYQLVHAVALLAVAQHEAAWRRRVGWCWVAGVLAFSGSLYVLALGGPRWLGPVTPLGGLALLAGWALVVQGFARGQTSSRQL